MTGPSSTIPETTMAGCCDGSGASFNADDGSGCMACNRIGMLARLH